jgi:hypothetical protein
MFSLLREPTKEEKKMEPKTNVKNGKNSTKKVIGNLTTTQSQYMAALAVTRGNVVTALAAHAAELGASGMGNDTEAEHVKAALHFFGRVANSKQGT